MRKAVYVVGFVVLLFVLGFIVITRPVSSDPGISIPKIEVSPEKVPLDGTVTFTVYGQLIDRDTGDPSILDPYLIFVRLEGIYVVDSDGITYTLKSAYMPVDIPKGGSWSITFGTNAPDKDKWDPASSTSASGSYLADFSGHFYTSEGGGLPTPWGIQFYFDVWETFEVPELTIAVAVAAAAPLLLGLKRRTTKK